MNIWIVSGFDPVPGLDEGIRPLRYGSIARAFEETGHNVVFWTSDFAHWRKQSRFNRDTTKELSVSLTAELLFAKSYSRNVSFGRVRHNRQLARAFIRRAELKSSKPDLILAEIPCLELAEAAATFAKKHNIPFVCDIQDIWPDVYLTVLPRPLWSMGRLILAAEYARLARILKTANAITAVSKQYLEWAGKYTCRSLSANDRVYPLGYRLPGKGLQERARNRAHEFMQQHGLEAGQTLATFLGQFATSYDLETVVAAAALLRSYPNLRLVIAGAGDKGDRIRRAAAGLSNVTVTGWLDQIDSIALLCNSRIGLAAYAPRAAQSLPYKPFEYMAYGLPIVSSLSGELCSIIEQNQIGCLYRAGSAESLANAIIAITKDSSELLALGSRARALFEREYDAEKIYPGMSLYLSTIVQNRRKSR